MKNFLKTLTNRNILVLIAILVFALLIRVILLNRFPIGITHDELNYVIAAKSLFWTNSFSPGTAPAVLHTAMSNFTVTVAEIPALILAPIVGMLSSSLFTSRVVGSILSVMTVLAVYFIALHISKKRNVALICALLMTVNPWSILMGRTIFEVNFFVAFFLWGFLVLIKSRGWRMFYALPLYLLGFFSYTGGQISFYIFMVISLVYHFYIYDKDRKDLKKHLIFFGIISVVFTGYVFIVTGNQSFRSRGSELYLPNQPQISQTVDQERKLAVQSQINDLFINKATVYFSGFFSKYLNTFSVNNLFLNGELRTAFSYQTHGTMYLLDFLFILIGLSSLFIFNKKGWALILSIIAGCSITSGLNIIENSYSQRVGLIYPFLVILSGIGIATLITSFKSKRMKFIISFIITIVYFVSFLNLIHIYFFRFPVYASDGWFFQDRVLSKYIIVTQQKFPEAKILVYSPEPKIIFEEYLFYSNKYNGPGIRSINEHLNQKKYTFENVTFTDICPKAVLDKNSVIIFDGTFQCDSLTSLTQLVRITRLKDVYENYIINNDKLCSNLELNKYIPSLAYRNFTVEKQSTNEFCLNWITRIDK